VRRNLLVFCWLAISLGGSIGCDRTSDISDILTVSPKVYEPDAVIEMKTGQIFTLLLDSNATTGYQWQLAEKPDENFVKLVGSEYLAPEVSIPGRGGQEKWTFKAQTVGSTTLNFKYVRPWESNNPAKTVKYTLTVH
jgi:inhibitor of cysteine peptidase